MGGTTLRSLACLCVFALLLTLTAVSAGAQPQSEDTGGGVYEIQLKSRTFTPAPGVERNAIRAGHPAHGNVHFLMQLFELPNAERRGEIAAQGFELLEYVSGNAYIAVARVADLNRLEEVEGLRWAGPIEEDDKISPALRRGEIGQWARAGQGRIVINVQGHADVGVDELTALVEHGQGEVVGSSPLIRTVTAVVAPGQVRPLARENIVQYIDVVAPQLETENDVLREQLGVNTVWDPPYELDGEGVVAFVFDVGVIDDEHPDFEGRVLSIQDAGISGHATHVAGVLLGDGANSDGTDSQGNPNNGDPGQWAGVAPAAGLRSSGPSGSGDGLYDDPGTIDADFTTAIEEGIDLANMSLGHPVRNLSLDGDPPCDLHGDYTLTAILADEIVRGSIEGQQLTWFKSAGNERGFSQTHNAVEVCGDYGTINSPKTAKNTIAVGAINADNSTMTGFSSWGPTDDGRLKPDIVAPGDNTAAGRRILSPDYNAAPLRRDFYGNRGGTSMAAPAAAGVTALVTQQWQQLHGAGTRPLSHTAKAMLIHTAVDLGNTGPDYRFGWGAVDAVAAVDLVIDDHDDGPRIHVESADQGDERFWTFNSDGTDDVRVTIVWDDPPATQLADNTLINDLDLRLVGPDGTVHEPFVLDPDNPAQAATTGNDDTNNVEVVVGDAAEGTWTVTVTGTAVPEGPQEFTLVTPDAAVENRPPEADAGGPYETDEGEDVDLDAGGSSDPDGDTLTYEWDLTGDGDFSDASGETATFDLVGFRGDYPIAVKVTDEHGAFDVDATTVTVHNVAPSVDEITTNSPIDEGEELVISGSASDPGWLTDLVVTVDWGHEAFPVEVLGGTLDNTRPDAVFDFTGGNVYGDRGTFTIEVCADDGLAEVCDSVEVTVNNVDPTAEIDTSDALDVDGEPTFLTAVGELFTASGRATDPGSDDLTLAWSWGDGAETETVYLNDPDGPDPFPSPDVNPRDVTDTQSHTYADACFYTLVFHAADDDGGEGQDAATVIVVGDADAARSPGYWLNQYQGRGASDHTTETLECYLDIAGHLSQVFHDERDASTLEAAAEVLHPRNARGEMRVQLDRQLLAAWLNLANGAIGFDELVDTDGDGVGDTAFSDVLATAEAARLDPGASDADFEAHKDVLERINTSDA